jgi:hypothetical protein
VSEKPRTDWEAQRSEKLAALRELAVRAGLIAPCGALAVSHSELDLIMEKYGAPFVALCLLVVADPSSAAVSRSACATLLDCFIPEWRQLATPALLGMVAEREGASARAWRNAVLSRDGHRCTCCGSSSNLEAHHIVRWVDAPWLRVVESNGKTLCRPCHAAHHSS